MLIIQCMCRVYIKCFSFNITTVNFTRYCRFHTQQEIVRCLYNSWKISGKCAKTCGRRATVCETIVLVIE